MKLADFAPLSIITSAPLILVANTTNERTASVTSMADFVAMAKSKNEDLRLGTGGPGNLTALAFQMLGNAAGFRPTYVPYKGSAATQAGLLGKEVDFTLDTPVALPQIAAGKLKAIAVTSGSRWPDLPDVPTMAESGFPGFDVTFWLALMAPADTPAPAIGSLYQAIASIRDDPARIRQLQVHGTLELMAPSRIGTRMRAESAAWGEVIKRENIELE